MHSCAVERFARGLGIAVVLCLCAPPLNAATASTDKSLAQLLSERAESEGFTIQGLDLLANDPPAESDTTASKSTLRELLKGYNYLVELSPAHVGDPQKKPVRVTILGRISDKAGAAVASVEPAAATAGAAADPATAASPETGAPPHPIVKALETIARSTLPTLAGDQGTTASGVSAAPQTVGSPITGAGADPANNAADMAALTAAASANVSALVAGLKAACPAGSHC